MILKDSLSLFGCRSWPSLWQEEETILFCAILLLKLFTSKMLDSVVIYPVGSCHFFFWFQNLCCTVYFSWWYYSLFLYMFSRISVFCRENICHIVKAPADVPWKIRRLATDVAYKAVSSLEGAGVFAVEMFLTIDGQVVLYFPHN